jgi:hypothetical protein
MGKRRSLVQGESAVAIRGLLTVAAAAYTLDAEDANKLLRVNFATAAVVTIPAQVLQEFDIGDFVEIQQMGAGTVTVSAGAGVTLRNGLAAAKPIAQWALIRVMKTNADEWTLSGNAG